MSFLYVYDSNKHVYLVTKVAKSLVWSCRNNSELVGSCERVQCVKQELAVYDWKLLTVGLPHKFYLGKTISFLVLYLDRVELALYEINIRRAEVGAQRLTSVILTIKVVRYNSGSVEYYFKLRSFEGIDVDAKRFCIWREQVADPFNAKVVSWVVKSTFQVESALKWFKANLLVNLSVK